MAVQGGAIPDDDDLASDISGPKQKWRANNDWLLESKTEMKARDCGRATFPTPACFTFATKEWFDTWSKPKSPRLRSGASMIGSLWTISKIGAMSRISGEADYSSSPAAGWFRSKGNGRHSRQYRREDREIPRTRNSVPAGFDMQDDFLEDMRQKYEWGYGFNEHNILAGKDDAKFTVGNQWDPVVEQRRKDQRKPVLTFNRLVAFVAQIVGNRLMNETEIRVNPDKAGTKEIAEIREGLIRSIFKNSNADFARDEAAKYQVVGGEGFFTLTMVYANDDVFEQEIKIGAVTDPYSVVLDPLAIEPSGEDAQWGFVGDDIPQQEFKRRWPWAAEVSFSTKSAGTRAVSGWRRHRADCVFWRMVIDGTKVLALYQDGTVHDVTEMEEFEYINFVETRSDGSPIFARCPSASPGFMCARATQFSKAPTIARFRRFRFTACPDGN
jgi:hypothetical protein